MHMQLATMFVSNATVVCVGGITRTEAEDARADGHAIDGFGYYLFLADRVEPEKPIRLLAKFLSSSEAQTFAHAMRYAGGEIVA